MRKLCFVLAFVFLTLSLTAQIYDQKLFGAMHWRNVGPFRGGRVLTVAGIPGDPEDLLFSARSPAEFLNQPMLALAGSRFSTTSQLRPSARSR